MFPLILPSCIYMGFPQDKTKSCKRCHRWETGWSFLATNYYQDQNHLSMMMVIIVMVMLMMMVMMQPKVCWNRMRRDEPIRAAMSTVTECQLRPDIAETPWDTIYHHHHHHHGRPRHHHLENQEQRGLLVSNAMTTGSKPKPSLLPTLLLFPSSALLLPWQDVMMKINLWWSLKPTLLLFPSWTPLPPWQHVMMMSMKKVGGDFEDFYNINANNYDDHSCPLSSAPILNSYVDKMWRWGWSLIGGYV